MKRFWKSPIALMIAAFTLFVGLIAATSADSTKYKTSAEKAFVYAWDTDTITNAGNDTLTIGDIQTSNWYGMLHVDGKQLSGTQGIAVIVQYSGFANPDADQWAEETRDTLNGSAENLVIDLGRMEALSYRVIVDGYGTQSSEYEPALVLKKD
jgi:hypothetical protein